MDKHVYFTILAMFRAILILRVYETANIAHPILMPDVFRAHFMLISKIFLSNDILRVYETTNIAHPVHVDVRSFSCAFYVNQKKYVCAVLVNIIIFPCFIVMRTNHAQDNFLRAVRQR